MENPDQHGNFDLNKTTFSDNIESGLLIANKSCTL